MRTQVHKSRGGFSSSPTSVMHGGYFQANKSFKCTASTPKTTNIQEILFKNWHILQNELSLQISLLIHQWLLLKEKELEGPE